MIADGVEASSEVLVAYGRAVGDLGRTLPPSRPRSPMRSSRAR